MAKKKTGEEGKPKVVAKCDNLYKVTYSQSDIRRNFPFLWVREEMETLKSQFATSSWGSHKL